MCDCHLLWLSQWLRGNPNLAVFTKCSSPVHLKNVEVAELQDNDFTCSGIRCFLFMYLFIYLFGNVFSDIINSQLNGCYLL
jgi:hypothetical protein